MNYHEAAIAEDMYEQAWQETNHHWYVFWADLEIVYIQRLSKVQQMIFGDSGVHLCGIAIQNLKGRPTTQKDSCRFLLQEINRLLA